jgi:hypothetical protein
MSSECPPLHGPDPTRPVAPSQSPLNWSASSTIPRTTSPVSAPSPSGTKTRALAPRPRAGGATPDARHFPRGPRRRREPSRPRVRGAGVHRALAVGAVEHHRNREPIQHAMSTKTAQRRAHEGLESDEGRHRVAGQPEDRHALVLRDAEREWFARLHRDLHRARLFATELEQY